MNLLRMLEIDAILELFKKDDRARNSSIVSNFPEFLSKQNRRDFKAKNLRFNHKACVALVCFII